MWYRHRTFLINKKVPLDSADSRPIMKLCLWSFLWCKEEERDGYVVRGWAVCWMYKTLANPNIPPIPLYSLAAKPCFVLYSSLSSANSSKIFTSTVLRLWSDLIVLRLGNKSKTCRTHNFSGRRKTPWCGKLVILTKYVCVFLQLVCLGKSSLF
jgi:hypothetical protein